MKRCIYGNVNWQFKLANLPPRLMSSTILCPWSGRKGISGMSQPSFFRRCFSCNIVSMMENISTSPPKWSDSVKVHPAGPNPFSGAGGSSFVTFRKCTKCVREANSLAISSTLKCEKIWHDDMIDFKLFIHANAFGLCDSWCFSFVPTDCHETNMEQSALEVSLR